MVLVIDHKPDWTDAEIKKTRTSLNAYIDVIPPRRHENIKLLFLILHQLLNPDFYL